MLNYQITISGQVQGVGFRWSCYRLAQQLEITGFVRNLPTGQVYVEAQGPRDRLQSFIRQLAAGPTPFSQVTAIHKFAGHCQDYGNSFTIRR